jgi:Ubiquitin carboxyl-terminal hydrolase
MIKHSLKFISEKVQKDDPRDLPFIQILKLLIKQSHVTVERPLYSKQYFQLLKNLLKKYLDLQKNGRLPGVHIFNHRGLLDSYIKSLIEYQSQERKGDADYEDYNLISYMQLIHVLLKNEPRFLTEENQNALADELVGKCLFLTSENQEGSQINKCQSKASRGAANELLQALCHINPKIVAMIIGKHMSKVVGSVIVPKNINYQPELVGKTYGYQGIVNQGNTCYMNALLQQLFTTPQFRYQMFAANDDVAPTYVEFKGDQVDDNMLH